MCSELQIHRSSTACGVSSRPSPGTINPGTMFLLVQSCSIVSLCSGHLWLSVYVKVPWTCSEEQIQVLSSLFVAPVWIVSDHSSACRPISFSRHGHREIWQHVMKHVVNNYKIQECRNRMHCKFWLCIVTVLSLHRECYYERFQASCNLQPVRCHHCLLQVVLRWLMYTSCTGQVEVLKVAVMTYMRSQICNLSSIAETRHTPCVNSHL